MLVLEPRNDRVLLSSVQSSVVGLDRNLVQVEGLDANFRYFRNRTVQSKYIGYPDLPYIFNIDKYIQNTIVLQGSREAEIDEDVVDNILRSYQDVIEEHPNHLIYLRLYAYDYKCLDSYFLDKEQWVSHTNDNISSLYHKTMNDMVERESLYDVGELGARLYHNTECRFIIEVINWDDIEQASDYFLTLGIIPMLYDSIKELFNEPEIKYCKELVRRSQVKRIRNVEPVNLYTVICTCNKYQEALKDFRFKAELDGILRMRRRTFENRLQQAIQEKDQLMSHYHEVLTRIQQCSMQLSALQDDKEFRQEIEMVTKMKPMKDFELQGNVVYLTLVSELEYYDPELLDITLSRNSNTYDDDMTNQFFRDVFIEEKYKYFVGQKYPFRLDEQNFALPQQIQYNLDPEQLHCLYNPHIEYYHCYGNNEPQIIQAHREKDLMGYANALVSSLKNVNFADGAVFSRWYRNIRDFLYNENGNEPRQYARVQFLFDKENEQWISLQEYAMRYRDSRRRQREAEAVELEPRIAGEED